jgi:ribosomal protein S18 acetylase RimI-like enzyme
VDDRFEIRPATEADVEGILPLAVEAARAVGVDRDASAWRALLTEDVEHPDRLLVVALEGEETVGYARAHLVELPENAPDDHAPAGYYLIGLYVRPDRQRRGIADGLTEARLAWIRERADEAWFFTAESNEGSMAQHRRLGFREVSRQFSFRALNGGHVLFRAPTR